MELKFTLIIIVLLLTLILCLYTIYKGSDKMHDLNMKLVDLLPNAYNKTEIVTGSYPLKDAAKEQMFAIVKKGDWSPENIVLLIQLIAVVLVAGFFFWLIVTHGKSIMDFLSDVSQQLSELCQTLWDAFMFIPRLIFLFCDRIYCGLIESCKIIYAELMNFIALISGVAFSFWEYLSSIPGETVNYIINTWEQIFKVIPRDRSTSVDDSFSLGGGNNNPFIEESDTNPFFDDSVETPALDVVDVIHAPIGEDVIVAPVRDTLTIETEFDTTTTGELFSPITNPNSAVRGRADSFSSFFSKEEQQSGGSEEGGSITDSIKRIIERECPTPPPTDHLEFPPINFRIREDVKIEHVPLKRFVPAFESDKYHFKGLIKVQSNDSFFDIAEGNKSNYFIQETGPALGKAAITAAKLLLKGFV